MSESTTPDKRFDSLSAGPYKKHPKLPYAGRWTQIRVRVATRNILADLAKIHPVMHMGIESPRSINSMLEEVVIFASSRLVHHDMGPSYKHTPDAYCGCGPSWPAITKVPLA